MGLSEEPAQLIAALVQTGAYGIYLVLFPTSVHFLREHRKSLAPTARTHNSILFGAAFFLFCLITANWALDVNIARQTYSDPTVSITAPQTASSALLVIETAVLDAVLIYRLHTIWAKRFDVIVLPSLCLVGSLLTGIAMCFAPAQLPITSNGYRSWLALSLVTNGLAVALIAYRMWSLNRERGIETICGTNLSFASVVIMESAAIYCACNLATLIAQVLHNLIMITLQGMMSVATGIVFSLLLIRVREERRSRLLERVSEVIETPPPLRSHALVFTFKSSHSDLA